MKTFLKIIFWEYIQNLPIIAGFIVAFDLWKNVKYLAAIICIIGGSMAGAILIALTEARKQDGYKEPRSVLLANIASMTVIMAVMVVYFAASWGKWTSDLIIGILVGTGLGIVQSSAAKKKINWVHCVALGIASPLILISIRQLLYTGWSIWLNILLVCFLATLVICIVDYLPDTLSTKS